MRSPTPIALLASLLLLVGGCYENVPFNDPDGSTPPWDAAGYDAGAPPDGGEVDAFVPPPGKCVEPVGVDLLMVVDNSNSMTEEQSNLAAGLPLLVERLVDPPDEDGDLEPDWLPVDDLRIGVVTTDMGTGGFNVPTCALPDFGDDGVLLTRGNTSIGGCLPTYPQFLSYDPRSGMSPSQFAAEASCVTTVGVAGCGFEQPLEAALKALSPDRATGATGPGYTPPAFFRATSGHALGANAGFVRDDSLLAVVVVTDEEDCSAADPALFDPASPVYGATDLNLRCAVHAAEGLHPVARYVDGLASLRAERLDLLAFSVIAGIPQDLAVPEPSDADFQRMLDDPRMVEEIDPENPTRLRASCESPELGLAFPPRRLIEVARGLSGSRATVQSICEPNLDPAVRATARLVGTRACNARMVD